MSTKDNSASLPHLRSLLAAATPGRWTWDDDLGEIQAPHRCDAGCEPGSTNPRDVRWHTRPTVVLETDSGMYIRGEDAALIVALVNAAPALLDVVEAAEAVARETHAGGATTKRYRLHEALRAALAKLPRGDGESAEATHV